MSNLSKSGVDVQSLVSISGETDAESVIAADDVNVEEKIQDTKSTVKRATKTCNLFCTCSAKLVEKQCCAFNHPRSNVPCTKLGFCTLRKY